MQQTITLPYLRTSPLHIPRRDLVAAASDSFSLRVVVVERDDPAAELLTITGGIGGPAAQLVITTDRGVRHSNWGNFGGSSGGPWGAPWGWDYGMWGAWPLSVLWSAAGTPQVGLGAFDWFLPAGTMMNFPLRCGWAIQLGWDGNTKAETLAFGTLNVGLRFGGMAPVTDPLLTDDLIPVHTDTDQQVYA